MSAVLKRAGLALIAIVAVAACEDEPMSPGASGVDEFAVEAVVRGSPRDRAAIQEIVNTFDDAWTDGDPARYAAQYAGAEWVGPDGTILDDPAAIRQVYDFVIGVLLAGTTRESTIRQLTFLTGTFAVIDLDVRVTGFEEPPPGELILVLGRKPGLKDLFRSASVYQAAVPAYEITASPPERPGRAD